MTTGTRKDIIVLSVSTVWTCYKSWREYDTWNFRVFRTKPI